MAERKENTVAGRTKPWDPTHSTPWSSHTTTSFTPTRSLPRRCSQQGVWLPSQSVRTTEQGDLARLVQATRMTICLQPDRLRVADCCQPRRVLTCSSGLRNPLIVSRSTLPFTKIQRDSSVALPPDVATSPISLQVWGYQVRDGEGGVGAEPRVRYARPHESGGPPADRQWHEPIENHPPVRCQPRLR
jgi:hypothetical protein